MLLTAFEADVVVISALDSPSCLSCVAYAQ